MIIESANLLSLAPSSTAVEGVTPPLVNEAGISEGFSDALVAQIELLSAIKTEASASVQVSESIDLQEVNVPHDVVGLPVDEVDAQGFAALLGNNLPPSYKTKDDVDHEAALAAVTDAWKYIGLEASAGEKAKVVVQDMKVVPALATPVSQGAMNVIAMPAATESSTQSKGEKVVEGKQDTTDVATEAEQVLQDIVVMDVPMQMELEQRNDKPDKEQAEGGAQLVVVENNGTAEELLAAVVTIPPTVMQAEQLKTTNNPASEDTDKSVVTLPYTKPLIASARPQQPANVLENKAQSETTFRQPAMDKPAFNLSDFQNSGQTEEMGRTDPSGLSLEEEKILPRVGTDMALPNNKAVDNKTDVPAMTKPLSHPEWSKDLGERIVWMNNRAIPSAEIRLNPPHMGPISVRVDVADDQATVVFTAQHSAVRETLEASIPKLREMMGSQHLNLVEANVFQGAASDQGRSQAQNFAQTADGRRQMPMAMANDVVDELEQEVASGRAVVSNGLLSLYA